MHDHDMSHDAIAAQPEATPPSDRDVWGPPGANRSATASPSPHRPGPTDVPAPPTSPWSQAHSDTTAAQPVDPMPVDPTSGEAMPHGVEAPVVLESATGPARSRQRMLVGAACVMALVIGLGAVLLVVRADRDRGGAATPEEAIVGLLDSLGREDVLSAVELLDPYEREHFVQPSLDLVDELVRLGLLDPTIDLTAISGLDLRIDQVTYDLLEVPGAPDLQHVIFTGGTITATVDGDTLPVGQMIRDHFGEQIALFEEQSTENMASDDPLVLKERDGRWYLSLLYTAAENARISESAGPAPAPGDGLVPIGAETPQEAVAAMIQSLVDLDLAGVIARLDPHEAEVAQRYGDLYAGVLADAERDARQSLGDADATIAVSDVAYSTIEAFGHTAVSIDAATVDVRSADTRVRVAYSPSAIDVEVDGPTSGSGRLVIDGRTITLEASSDSPDLEQLQLTLTFGTDAVTLTGTVDGQSIDASLSQPTATDCWQYDVEFDGDGERGCIEEMLSEFGMTVDLPVLAELLGSYQEFALPTPDIVVEEVDGQWYVAPVWTVMDAYRNGLQQVDPGLVEWYVELIADLTSSELGLA